MHQHYLKWLVYIVGVVGLTLAGIVTGLLPSGIVLDKSYLSVVILSFYAASEAYLGYLTILTSKEIEEVKKLSQFLESEDNVHFEMSEKHLIIQNDTNGHKIELDQSNIGTHIKNVLVSKVSPNDLTQKMFMDSLINKIYSRNSYAQFASNLIVFLGLLGTIVGIIMTFWPFMDPNVVINTTKIQSQLGQVFSGVGAAFYPSVFAAITCVFLIINDRIIMLATNELLDRITAVTENFIIPMVKVRPIGKKNEPTQT